MPSSQHRPQDVAIPLLVAAAAGLPPGDVTPCRGDVMSADEEGLGAASADTGRSAGHVGLAETPPGAAGRHRCVVGRRDGVALRVSCFLSLHVQVMIDQTYHLQ